MVSPDTTVLLPPLVRETPTNVLPNACRRRVRRSQRADASLKVLLSPPPDDPWRTGRSEDDEGTRRRRQVVELSAFVEGALTCRLRFALRAGQAMPLEVAAAAKGPHGAGLGRLDRAVCARRGAPARLPAMARVAMNSAAALVLLAALPALAACAAPGSSTAGTPDRLPSFGWAPPRMRAPSAERPSWLPSLPSDLPRIPTPGDGFRA